MSSVSPPVAPAAEVTAEALIAQARERARRRRRKIALAVVLAAAASGGALVLTGVIHGGRATNPAAARPLPLAARAGEVTGYLDPCVAVVLPGRPNTPAFAAGTVTALPGTGTWKQSGGAERFQLPAAAPAARQHVASDQAYALRLPPGRYTLVARYDSGADVVISVTVRADRVVRQNFPDDCK